MCACPPLGMCTVHGTRHTQRQGGQVSWAGTPVVTVAGLGGWVSNKRFFKTNIICASSDYHARSQVRFPAIPWRRFKAATGTTPFFADEVGIMPGAQWPNRHQLFHIC
jgi:hypothetical protein